MSSLAARFTRLLRQLLIGKRLLLIAEAISQYGIPTNTRSAHMRTHPNALTDILQLTQTLGEGGRPEHVSQNHGLNLNLTL